MNNFKNKSHYTIFSMRKSHQDEIIVYVDFLRVGVMSYSDLISSRLCTNTTICYLNARDYMYHMN